MREETFTFANDTGHDVFVYRWLPAESERIRGIIQIAHGMSETAARYQRFALALTEAGFVVYANDHRGHGKTAGTPEELGWPGEDGFNGMARDMISLGTLISAHYPDLPLFLFGHSMGSFLSQKVMYEAPEAYHGFLLSGTNGPRGLLSFGQQLATLQCKLQGPQHPSLLMNAITFGSFNKRFLPMRTPFDWLSRDEAEVDKYINAPMCGFICSAGFFSSMFALLREIHKNSRLSLIPKDKPVYIFGGDSDPVGLYGAGPKRLAEMYVRQGIRDVQLKLYAEGRHEMLNEINRDEVTQDCIEWINKHLS